MKRLSVALGLLVCLALFGFIGWLGSQTLALKSENERQDVELTSLRSSVTTTTAPPTTTTTAVPVNTSGMAKQADIAALRQQVETLHQKTGEVLHAQQKQINCLTQQGRSGGELFSNVVC